MTDLISILERERLVPVIRAPNAELAYEACEGLVEGGIRILEVTLTVPGATDVISKLKSKYALSEGYMIGAGSVVSADDVKSVADSGADFMVTPGTLDEAWNQAEKLGATLFPGALTPSEVVRADAAGAKVIKIFPCSAMGGASYIKALKAPLPRLKLLPTGGIKEDNAKTFLDAGASGLGVGSNLVDIKKLQDEGRDSLARIARRFISSISED